MAPTDDRPAPSLLFELSPIPKVDVHRAIIGQLEAAIMGLAPGTRIGSERELAEQLDVSRVAVREALRALESMGRIEIRRNSGSYVADAAPPREEVDIWAATLRASGDASIGQLIDVRAAIETRVIEVVARRPGADLTHIVRLLERMGNELRDERGMGKGSLDLRFEAALGRESGNPLLIHLQAIVHELWVRTWLDLGGAVGDRAVLHGEHLEILAAMRRGDAAGAVARMARHVDPRPSSPASG